ncbi:hypothetical protein [Halobellus ordinarius]|uniref:hypothetical protein n=1 Tax=Halobellus ordinarius TaxID=3075120 RepID=UPI00288081C5|nr:hypothetical protein [Halobellus sp. ZY16]
MQRSNEEERTERVDPSSLLDDVDGIDDRAGSAAATGEGTAAETTENGGRLRGLFPSFSLRSFLVVLALSLFGTVAGGSIPLVGSIGQFVGLFLAAFVVGLVGSRGRYFEVALAGAIAAGVAFVIGTLTSLFAPVAIGVLADYGLAIAGIGTGAGVLVALAGHYFGRDLRDGLTREI